MNIVQRKTWGGAGKIFDKCLLVKLQKYSIHPSDKNTSQSLLFFACTEWRKLKIVRRKVGCCKRGRRPLRRYAHSYCPYMYCPQSFIHLSGGCVLSSINTVVSIVYLKWCHYTDYSELRSGGVIRIRFVGCNPRPSYCAPETLSRWDDF